jgi:protein TonB
LIASARAPGERRGESRRVALTASALLAGVVHAGLLFGLRLHVHPVSLRDGSVEVTLVAPEASLEPSVAPSRGTPRTEPAPARLRAAPPAPAAPKLARPLAEEPSGGDARELEPTAPTPELRAGEPASGAVVEVDDPSPFRAPVAARPKYKLNPEPPYPLSARRRRQEGEVLLSVRVDATGRAESVEVLESSGFAALDAAALAAVERWEFEPGTLDGAPVPTRVEVPIRFELE